MELIDEKTFKEIKVQLPEKRSGKRDHSISDDDFNTLMSELQNPIKAQKEIAVKVKVYLDNRIQDELELNGELSEGTRRWIESFNSILEKLQRAIHGDKSLNINVHKISNQDIAAKIREQS